MFIKTLKEALPYLTKANIATLIWGHHGIGKSQAVRQYAESQGIGFVDLRLGTNEVGDLLGLADFAIDPKTGEKIATKFMRPDWFPTDPDSKGIVFLDEINRARRDVLQAAFQLVLDRQLHTHKLPPGWFVVAAANPNTEDYIVTDISDKAFMDRFCHVKLTPSTAEWFEHAENKKFDGDLIAFLKDQPEMLQASQEDFSLDFVKPSRRSWEGIDRLKQADTPMNILQELGFGLVGHVATIAMMESFKNSDKPLTAEDIINEFPKHKKRVAEYANSETGGRVDLLKHTTDSIVKQIQDRNKTSKKKLTKKEETNLLDFLKTIPKDLTFSTCRELYYEEIMREPLEKDKEIRTILEAARGKVKDKEKSEKTAQ